MRDTSFLLDLSLPDKISLSKTSKVIIDSPIIYRYDGVTQTVLAGKYIESTTCVNALKVAFIDCFPLSTTSFVLKVVNFRNGEAEIAKHSNDSIIVNPNILEKQIDGVFCTDGKILMNNKGTQLIYVYSHRNVFLSLDSNLNVLYRGRTIDTTSTAHFKVSDINQNGMVEISSPIIPVNNSSCMTDKYLFINSSLRANNENVAEFQNSSVIDIYSVKTGKYLYSFYLPQYRNKKVKDFRVINTTLIAIYDRYLYAFELNYLNNIEM